MKKAVLASLLAFAVAVPMSTVLRAQAPAGGIQMSPEEYAVYNAAATATTPADKAAKFENYLKAYPNSAVKADVLNQLLFAYSSLGDGAKTEDAGDRLLAIDPSNLRALTFEVYFHRADSDKMTDPSQLSARCAGLDTTAGYAQKGLTSAKPKDMSDSDFAALQKATAPTFRSAIADDDLCKKDNAGAITVLKDELHGVPEVDANDPAKQLQDVWVLAQAYYTSTPPDYLNCTWYATRALNYAPAGFKPTIQPVAAYCYRKYHGSADGYDKLQAMVVTSLDPPADLGTTIKPAPKPEDYVVQIVSTTPDLATLAISDKEFILQYGAKMDPKSGADAASQKSYADVVFDTVKGKSVDFPDALVVAATADQLQVAVADDSVTAKTADFTFAMKEPLKTIPAVGSKVNVTGTYTSYTASPLMITMSDGEVVEKKAPVKKPVPAHHPVAKKR